MTSRLLRLALVFSGCVPMNLQPIGQPGAQETQRMCSDPNYAYESGYNAGLERKRLDTAWVDTTCAPDWRAEIRLQYQNGYQSGMQHAPVVVRGLVAPRGEACRFSSDCGEDRSCRPDASGTSVCMGHGYAGDPCWFGSECVSNSCDITARTCK